MYLAMNRFHVTPDNAQAFEQLWLNRESRLHEMQGFVSFHMLKGPEQDGLILYASHTIWESESDFRRWTQSAAFRASHAGAGHNRSLHEGTPRFEGFTAIQSLGATQV